MNRFALILIGFLATTLSAQDMADMHHMTIQDSQTAAQSFPNQEPLSTPHEMIMFKSGKWTGMVHGQGFVTQTISRESSSPFSTNWTMAEVERPMGGGTLSIELMNSFEPLTVPGRQYYLLFQTGGTAFGKPILRGQHPHGFFMETALSYRHPLGNDFLLTGSCAPTGGPALGPIAFPHSMSASEMPEARLTHELIDHTHISFSVCTVGVSRKWWQLEASTFHGTHPGENDLWKAFGSRPDSFSGRASFAIGKNWFTQTSFGRIKNPDAPLEFGTTDRTTASAIYNRPLENGNLAITLAWGMDHERGTSHREHGIVLESNLRLKDKNYLFGRIERAERRDLIPDKELPEAPIAFTTGYSRDIYVNGFSRTALGADVSAFNITPELHRVYGDRPLGIRVFLRFRLAKNGEHMSCHH